MLNVSKLTKKQATAPNTIPTTTTSTRSVSQIAIAQTRNFKHASVCDRIYNNILYSIIIMFTK
jgi:hypothetical protein